MLQIQTGILKNIEFTIVANFILNQKILLEKHMGPEGYFIATKKSKETALQDLSWVFW